MSRNLQIEQLVGILHDTLLSAYAVAAESDDAMRQGNQNLAIGTLLPLAAQLETALALHRAAVTIHQSER